MKAFASTKCLRLTMSGAAWKPEVDATPPSEESASCSASFDWRVVAGKAKDDDVVGFKRAAIG